MVEIQAQLVSRLREMSGASMMECKKALVATSGNIDKAFDELRKAGLKGAEKKVDRATAQGLVAYRLAPDAKVGALVSLACETDFVAKTADFQGLLAEIADHLLAHEVDGVAGLMNQRGKSGVTFDERVKSVIGKLGENIRVVELARLRTTGGRVGAYLHFNAKTGALAALSSPAAPAAVDEGLKQLCMHITAARPRWISRAEVPAEALQREKDVLRESEDVKKKPAEMQEKILQGRLEKFYADNVLPEQPWTLEPALKVEKALQQSLGGPLEFEAFARFAIGG